VHRLAKSPTIVFNIDQDAISDGIGVQGHLSMKMCELEGVLH